MAEVGEISDDDVRALPTSLRLLRALPGSVLCVPAQIQQLKANATVFVVKLGAAGGWTDLSRQTALGVNQEEATYRAEADDIISRCLAFGAALTARYRWEDAKTFYKLALKVDPTLDEAMAGYEKACDNTLLTSGEDDSSVVLYTKVHDPELGPDGKTRFYRVQSSL